MNVVSAYMQKNSGSSAQLLNMEDGESSPQFTSQTPAGIATSAEVTVSQTSELVNEESSSAERKTAEAVSEMLLDFGVHKAAAQSLAEQHDPAEGLRDLFTDALNDAGKNYQTTGGQKIPPRRAV